MFISDHASIDDVILSVGLELRESLRELLVPLVGAEPKPSDIGEVLDLDRTQSWRIGKVLQSPNAYEVLHETPAPKGLALIVDAAERAGTTSAAAKQMRRTIASFAALLHEFPDGRAGLSGALAARVPKAEEATLKAAKKKVSQGMGQLMGLRASVRYVASVLTPSQGHEDLADVVAVAGYRELRRLRIGPAPVLFSGKTYTRPVDAAAPAVETLEGGDDPDPRLRLLSEFSELSADSLNLERSGDELRLVLSPDQPDVNEPITIFFAQRIARSLERTRRGEPAYELVHHAPLLPSDVNVFDTLIHKDLFPDASPPFVTVERFGFNPTTQVLKPDDTAFRVDEERSPADLGRGVERAVLRPVPKLPDLLKHVFTRIGEDPSDYRLYRTSLEHVPPGFAVVIWLRLSEE